MPRSPDEWKKSKTRKHLEDLITRVLNPAADLTEKDPWKIEEGTKLSIEDYINMKPFKMEDHNATIAFRINEKVLRAVQRIKERAGKTYDIKSDLERDVFVLGLMVMAERYEDIFATEMVIERMRNRIEQAKEIGEQLHRFSQLLHNQKEQEQRADFFLFMESLAKRPPRIQDLFMQAIQLDPLMLEMLRKMSDAEKLHGDEN